MDRQLRMLAAAHGVSVEYESSGRTRVAAAPDSVVAVLGLLGVDATSRDAIRDGLAAVRAAGERALPPTLVMRAGGRGLPLPGPGVVTLEDGGTVAVESGLPADLPLGYHRVACAGQEAHLIEAPRRRQRTPQE